MALYAKKSLGQNFLKSKEAIRSIIEAGNIAGSDTILEIGPGKGVLTAELLLKAGKVIAIEKDNRLIPVLTELFQTEIAAGKLEIIEADILDIDPETLRSYGSYKVIANIPYYITGLLIRKFLEATFQPERMVLLVQKEVALRIVARDQKESLLSMSVKAYGQPKYIQTVQAKYFSPEPNVDSAVILISAISKNFFDTITEQEFFDVVRTGFAHKRKVLAGNLKELIPTIKTIFEKISLGEKVRAEDIKLDDWKKIILETKTK
jgi:16S rRNA (adenine1518-N6/adenine1519-N6)-dimethyltransferase